MTRKKASKKSRNNMWTYKKKDGMWNIKERLEEAKSKFGAPCYVKSLRNESRKSYYWFGHKICLSSRNNFVDLKVRKEYWLWGDEKLYIQADNGWRPCTPDVQAAYNVGRIDDILLGDDDEQAE